MIPTLITHRMLAIIGGIVLLVLAVVTSILFVMTQGKAKVQQNVTLTVWGLEDESLYKKTFDVFRQANPTTKIIYKQQKLKSYLNRIKNRQINAKVGERPDIFLFHNSWTSQLTPIFTPAPATVVTQKTFSILFYPVAAKELVINGAIVGVPTTADSLALYYNKEILTSKGISPPQDWEAFSQAAVRLTTRDDQGNPQVAGAAIGSAKNIAYFGDILGLMFVQQETSPQFLGQDDVNSIIEYYAGDITKFAQGPERVWDANFEQDIEAFARGRVALIFAPAVAAREIRLRNPNLQFGIAPAPQLRPEEPKSFATYWAWGVSRYAPNTTLAWQLAWKLSERASLIRTNTALTKIHGYGMPYPRTDLASRQINDPIVGPFIRQAKTAASLPFSKQGQEQSPSDEIVQVLETVVTQKQQGQLVDLKQVGSKISELLGAK